MKKIISIFTAFMIVMSAILTVSAVNVSGITITYKIEDRFVYTSDNFYMDVYLEDFDKAEGLAYAFNFDIVYDDSLVKVTKISNFTDTVYGSFMYNIRENESRATVLYEDQTMSNPIDSNCRLFRVYFEVCDNIPNDMTANITFERSAFASEYGTSLTHKNNPSSINIIGDSPIVIITDDTPEDNTPDSTGESTDEQTSETTSEGTGESTSEGTNESTSDSTDEENTSDSTGDITIEEPEEKCEIKSIIGFDNAIFDNNNVMIKIEDSIRNAKLGFVISPNTALRIFSESSLTVPMRGANIMFNEVYTSIYCVLENSKANLKKIYKISFYRKISDNNFEDIDTSWAKDEIYKTINLGIVKGAVSSEDGKLYLNPDSGATRAEACAFMIRYIQADTAQFGNYKIDTVDEIHSWAVSYVKTAMSLGIMKGTTDPEIDGILFAPDKEITRVEFFAMLARTLNISDENLDDVTLPFIDNDKIPSWAINEIKALVKYGIIKGNEDGSLAPAKSISRAEILAALSRRPI